MKMKRIGVRIALALACVACAANRPSTERLLVLGSDENSQAAIDRWSIRGSTAGVRSVIYVVEYRQPQEADDFSFFGLYTRHICCVPPA